MLPNPLRSRQGSAQGLVLTAFVAVALLGSQAAAQATESPEANASSCSLGSYTFPAGPTYKTKTGTAKLSRTIPWAPGIAGGVPERTKVCATLSATGKGDDRAINAALANCSDNEVVKLNPGTYNIKNAIIWNKSNIVLRGSGGPGVAAAKQTRLMADPSLYGPVVNLGLNLFPHPNATSVNLTADAMQGTSSATVTSAAGFHVGDLVTVDMLVDPADDTGAWIIKAPAGGTGLVYPYAEYNPTKSPKGDPSRGWFSRMDRPAAQITEIQAISGNKITFSTPFHMTFEVAHAAQMTGWDTEPLTNSGLEDVYVSGVPAPGGNAQYNDVVITMAKYSWVKNVETDNSNGYGIGIDQAFRNIVRDSYIHSTINPTPGGAGYGLEFSMGSADNLAENNISWNFDKVMVMRASGGGNVMAYNYMDDGWIAYQPNWVESGINAAHMTMPHFELFEGNLSFALGADETWGGSTFITWLRNVATNHRSAWPPLNTYLFNSAKQKEGGCTSTGPDDDNCIPYTDAGNRASAQALYGDVFFNYVGNVLGSSGMPVAPESEGFTYANSAPDWPSDPVPMWTVGFGDWNGNTATDEGVVNTIFRDGNFDFATKSVHWAGSKQTIPDSLYSCSKPAFFGSYNWPWSDGSNASKPYSTHPFKYYPLSSRLGTFGASGTKVSYPGYQLPAFVRFLELHGIEQPPADCASATLANMPADCSLLFTGAVPETSLKPQTITFSPPTSPVTYGVKPITLSAKASSGLPVTFSVVSGPGKVSGSNLTIAGAGTVVVAANQAGNATFAAAAQVKQTVVVNRAAQTITFTPPTSPVTYGVAPIALIATGGASGNPVTFSVLSGPGSVSGNMLTITGVGTVVVAANQAGNANFAAAAQVKQTIVVKPAAQTTVTAGQIAFAGDASNCNSSSLNCTISTTEGVTKMSAAFTSGSIVTMVVDGEGTAAWPAVNAITCLGNSSCGTWVHISKGSVVQCGSGSTNCSGVTNGNYCQSHDLNSTGHHFFADCYYLLVAGSGVTGIKVTFADTSGGSDVTNMDLFIQEFKCSSAPCPMPTVTAQGTTVYPGDGSSLGCSSCNGPSMTVSGTNNIVIQNSVFEENCGSGTCSCTNYKLQAWDTSAQNATAYATGESSAPRGTWPQSSKAGGIFTAFALNVGGAP